MGAFLDKPMKEKESEHGEGNGLKYGLSSMQGWRVEMEDAHAIKTELTPEMKDCSYFAVFDGHAGDFVSKYSSEHLIGTILDLWFSEFGNGNVKDEENVNKCYNLTDQKQVDKFREKVIEGFLKIDSYMRGLPSSAGGPEKSGATAVAAFITPNKIIFANCGDSRALLCSSNDVKFVTYDHKPYNEEERKRIENAGGSVMIQRVNGTLAVSRALGDYDYKNSPDLPPTEQLVSAEPDLSIIDRSSDEDEFLILACDGIWDVMSNHEVISYIRSRLMISSDLKQICEGLLDTCLAKGSKDNMSVILITFSSAPQVNAEAVEKERILDDTIRKKIEELIKEYGEETNLNLLCDELQAMNLENLPPGGGIHCKMNLVEQILNSMLPDRNREEVYTPNLPIPLSVLQHLTQDPDQEGGEEET